MPYIVQKDRVVLDKWLNEIPFPPEFVGEGALNYVLTQICLDWLRTFGENYSHMKDVVGTLECVKEEFYRRVVAPYEQEKMEEHGDVY